MVDNVSARIWTPLDRESIGTVLFGIFLFVKGDIGMRIHVQTKGVIGLPLPAKPRNP
jgi:hypothetical protein